MALVTIYHSTPLNLILSLMIPKFNSIIEFLDAFPTERKCIEHLDQMRWNGKVISPFDKDSKVYKCRNNRYKCKSTNKYFSSKTGTIFDGTNIGLQKWYVAIWLVTCHKKGISSMQLSKDIIVTQKTAWYMLQKIRKCLNIYSEEILSGKVEHDTTYVGGKNKNRHKNKKYKYKPGREYPDKIPVMGAIERDGRMVAKIVPQESAHTIRQFMNEKVEKGSSLFVDMFTGYKALKGYKKEVVSHSTKKYVIGDAHTNNIEGAWTHFKKMIHGTYHNVSNKHLQAYVDEFIFRYNTRNDTEFERFNLFLQATNDKHITNKEVIDDKERD